ncbi:hypothetical protein SDC9_45040 [bioreactor metagenome]|uniref:Polysaccharide biosynthesis protein C-terminal domain-containing protein n=1 Tax=bioreactor metagenome TaxID=1076179 RepID=A0A644W5T5_9ZZZZ|nr:oligosaccharide flippase family protein [Paludibacter sp.]
MRVDKQHKQVLLLYSSTVIGLVLGILVSVLNTRSLSPSDYGDVKYVSNIMLFLSGLLTFGFFVSGCRLMAVSDSPQKTAKYKGVMILILIVSILLMFLFMQFSSLIHKSFLKSEISNLFVLGAFVSASPLLLNYINTTAQGDNKIFSISMARLLPSLVYLIIGYYIYRYFGATSERVIMLQNGISLIMLGIIIALSKPMFSNLKESYGDLKRENKKYGLHVYLGSLAGVSLNYLAGITLGLFNTDNTLVGFYTLALTISMPLAILPTIIGTTYYKRFALDKKIDKKIFYGTFVMTLISLFAFIVLIEPLVSILYSREYFVVAKYASVLAIGMAFHGFGDMINRFLAAKGQGKMLRNSAFVSGGVLVIGNVVLVYLWGIYGAIGTKIITSVTYFGYMYICYIKYINKQRLNDLVN